MPYRKRMPKKETVGIGYNIPTSINHLKATDIIVPQCISLWSNIYKGNEDKYYSTLFYVPSIVSRKACLCFHVLPHFDEQLLLRKKTKKRTLNSILQRRGNFLHLTLKFVISKTLVDKEHESGLFRRRNALNRRLRHQLKENSSLRSEVIGFIPTRFSNSVSFQL